jgi:hypothetical protein
MRSRGSATTANTSTAPHRKEASRVAAPKTAKTTVRPLKTLAAVGVRGGSEGFPQSGRRTPGFARVNRTSSAALMHAARTSKTTPRTWTTPMAASLHAASLGSSRAMFHPWRLRRVILPAAQRRPEVAGFAACGAGCVTRGRWPRRRADVILPRATDQYGRPRRTR